MISSEHEERAARIASLSRLDKFQSEAYNKVRAQFLKSTTIITSFAANAGTGKTATMIAMINERLVAGVAADQINATTFTNASAEDIRQKLIKAHVDLKDAGFVDEGGNNVFGRPKNLGIFTLHAHAAQMLKLCDPHIGGLSYYCELADAGSSGSDRERTAFCEALTFAVHATVAHHPAGASIASAIKELFYDPKNEDTAKRVIFPAQDLFKVDVVAKSKQYIEQERATPMNLGAFTNTGETGPDNTLAIATEALLRLCLRTKEGFDASCIGLPRYLFVDEAQDIDLNQFFYLFALALNGVSIVMVGDPRQTLYEFRNSVSSLPFSQKVLEALMPGIEVQVLDVSLRTNYRSRKQIIDVAEAASAKFIEMSAAQQGKYIKPIACNAQPSVCRVVTGAEKVEQDLPAVKFIVGEPFDPDRQDDEVQEAVTVEPGTQFNMFDPLAVLQRAERPKRVEKPVEKVEDDAEGGKAKTPKGAVLPMLGGQNADQIADAICNLYARSLLGESCAIIAKKRLSARDRREISAIIKRRFPNAIGDHEGALRLQAVNADRHNCFSHFRSVVHGTLGLEVQDVVPLVNLMVAGVIDFFFTAEKELGEALKFRGLRRPSTIKVVPPEKFDRYNSRPQLEQAVEIEMSLFFEAVEQELSSLGVSAGPAFRAACVKFCVDVLAQLNADMWRLRQTHSKVDTDAALGEMPVRFWDAVTVRDQKLDARKLRSWREMRANLRRFWEALIHTVLNVEDALMEQMVENEGFPHEFIPANATFANLQEKLVGLSALYPELRRNLPDAVRDREESYKQFSNVWHSKGRAFCRKMTAHVGKLKREFPSQSRDEILARAFGHFNDVRNECKLSTFRAKDGKILGLFQDFLETPEEIAISKAQSQRKTTKGVIEVATVHASKGLEWQHVAYFTGTSSSQDYKATAKSFRDALYVAMTRARRTLVVVVPKLPPKPAATDGGGKLLIRVVHAVASEFGLFNATIDYGDEMPTKEEGGLVIHEETSHSEIESGMACRLRRDFLKRRQLPTMTPVSMPDYAFFFHRTMAALCAAVAEQRVEVKSDPIFALSRWINAIITRGKAEQELAAQLWEKFGPDAPGGSALLAIVQAMVPLYNRLDEERSDQLLKRYAKGLSLHLAAIISRTSLFGRIMAARGREGCKILIEKPVREVIEQDGELLPLAGIPDIRILTKDELAVFDYKTVPIKDKDRSEEEYEVNISEKTAIQVNLYQGIEQENLPGRVHAELIYVLNLTVRDGMPVPDTIDVLPPFRGGRGFVAVEGCEHVRVLRGTAFDTQRFQRTKALVSALRRNAREIKPEEAEFFRPCPLIGDTETAVAGSDCMLCQFSIHCAKNQARLPVEDSVEEEANEFDFAT
jgi:superfamily I DNA/RNA helicase